ncbi:MG2 domain-containing protein [Algivirga pacifica]|uniref:MG2 domain-containing protein n=1 Tax=Algivirga pacifica TaxID=1162670 RepID=A0ABP9DLD3_9BACT
MNRLYTPFFILLSCWVLSACKYSASNQNDTFSSPKSLFVDQISSFTAGKVSIGTDIRIKLTKNISDSIRTVAVEDVFTFSPTIKGKAAWQDDRTLVFTPSSPLQSNHQYHVQANLKSIFPEIDPERSQFKFTFETLEQNFSYEVIGLKVYDQTDLTRVKLEGIIETADITPFDKVKKMLEAEQEGEGRAIDWKVGGKANTFHFTVNDIIRGKDDSEVELSFNGEAIGVDRSTEYEIDIPTLDTFEVTSTRIVRGNENYISVLFSDPINNRQNLNGLVAFNSTSKKPRIVVNLNELKVYPTHKTKTQEALKIFKGIENTAGYKLKEDYTAALQFAQIKPAVRLVNKDNKVIMPNSKGLVLPFEAVGLKAVDVTVIRVFENNMLQYFQTNALGESKQLRRVAKPVIRKTIPLNTTDVNDLNAWNRYTLDLEDILTTEQGALYQVEIGFNKANSLYFCAANEAIESLPQEEDNWDAEEETSYWDDVEYYYNPNYNWQERDNPCSASYYGRRRSASKMIFASDLGMIAKQRDGGKMAVFVTNLLNTSPLSGVEVEVYDYQQQLINREATDGNGKAIIELDSKPFVVVAKKDNQTGYLKVDDGSALSLSNFDITGTQVQKGLKGFIYGERGVWRPGDFIHLGFMLEDTEGTLPENHPVVMELYNPSNQLVYRKVNEVSVDHLYRFDFETLEDAPTGSWRAEAKVGGAVFSKTIKIETIKPNRLKIDLSFPKETFTAKDRAISGNLNVRWLSGAKANNLKAEYDLLLRPMKTTFKGYANVSFDDESKSFSSDRNQVFEGRVDNEGKAKININLGGVSKAPGALMVNLYGKVYEEGGEFSIGNTSVPFYPYTSFVGVKAPEGDRRGILLTDQDHSVRVVSVDAEGNPVDRNNISVELYKLNWKWWWDNSYDNISNYLSRSYKSPIAKGKIDTRNGEGSWNLRVNHPEWGRYYLKVEDPVSGHSAGQVVYLDWPGWAGKGKRGGLDGASMLDFGIEKEEYKVGEQITLSIPSTQGNRVLVSLETGSEQLQTFWVETEEGNTTISFEATPDMAPNIYAHITMIQPHEQTINDLPIRLYGVQSIKVIDQETVLEPVINMPKELRPEQTYTVEVSEKSGKAMAYTLAIVDEGLLDITNYKTPEPWSSFYSREALGIKTWDVYDDVMGAFSGKLEHLLAIGGDEEIAPKDQNETNRFKPVVEFLGPFKLEAGDKMVHTIKMPQYIGSVKTMVVATGNNAFGSSDLVTPVKQPLMISATLPRVAGPGESMKLPVNVFALEDKIKEVQLSIETSGALVAKGAKQQKVRFYNAGDKVIFFDLEAKELLGQGTVKVTAKSGGITATYDINLDIIPRNPGITVVSDTLLDSDAKWSYAYQPIGIAGENKAYVEVSTLPSLNIEQRLGYLIRYPHGCVEQTTSAVFAQLYLDKLMELTDEQKNEIQTNVDAGISRLKTFQLGNGGLSYWPGQEEANHWGTNYAGHFLVEAKKAGYAVPEGMLSQWISYQSNKAENWTASNGDGDHALIQAYRLYTLALAEQPALGAMNRMKEDLSLSTNAKWRLALAYAIAGYKDQAEVLIEGGNELIASTSEDAYRYTYGSETRDKAMLLETLTVLDKRTHAFEVLMKIASNMANKAHWMSTQTTAYSMIAIAKYAAEIGMEGETDVLVNVDGEEKELSGKEYLYQTSLQKADKKTSITLSNEGGSPVFVRVIRSGTPLTGTESSSKKNLSMEVTYEDMSGNVLDVTQLKQGTSFKAIVSVKNPGVNGHYKDMALTQIFPSGWEIINTRLDGSMALSTTDYMDIRDDRVMHYFDLKKNEVAEFEVLLNASYQGKYYLPAVTSAAMYDNTIYATKAGQWVTVVPEQ